MKRHPCPWLVCTQASATAVLLIGASVAAFAGPVYADNIDDQLMKQAPAIVSYLKNLKKGEVVNVGVLRFRVKKGVELPTFAAGPMNTNMPVRLENLLAMSCTEADSIRLLHNPGSTIASKKNKLGYLDAAGRAELLKLNYSVVGSDKEVHADVFLIGMVELSPDYAKTSLKLQAFRPAQLNPDTVLQFTVPTDRSILADVGENFIITKRDVKKGESLDQTAIRSIKKSGGDPGEKPPIKDLSDLSEYIQFTVEYTGVAQKIEPDAKKTQWQVANASPDQNIVIKMKNISDRTLGVELSVNGENTIYGVERAKWIIDPSKEYKIKGFYRKDKTVAPFKVIPAESADEIMDEERVGLIQYSVYSQEIEKEKKKISLRGITNRELLQKRPASMEQLKQRIPGLLRERSGVIIPDDVYINGPEFLEVDFPDPAVVGSRTIRYLEKEKAKDK